jgi:hypothetical protein
MTDARQTPEEQLLKHYREQHTGEPSEQLDALILAAARRAAPAPSPACGNAGCRPARNRAGRSHSPAWSVWR